MKNKEIKDELKGLSPFLSNLEQDKKQGLGMPSNYFEGFEDRLMSRIKEEEALEGKQSSDNKAPILPLSSFWTYVKRLLEPKYAVGFSTCLVVLVFALYTVNNNNSKINEECETLLACLTTEEANAYIITNIEEFATEDIVATMESEDVTAIQEKLPTIKETLKEELEPIISVAGSSAMDKALESAAADDLLDDLTAEDLEDEDEDEDLF